VHRHGQLFDAVVAVETLREAFLRAARGKRCRSCVRMFEADLDTHLASMSASAADATFPHGRFRQFVIHDPKRRVITAPCFEERVLHHAIVAVCEPVFERWLIADTYACRPGRGREAAVIRAAGFSRRFPWCVHLDVRSCFDSIPHERLTGRLACRFKDPRLLLLFTNIIQAFRRGIGRGLPIGSLCSQHFANFYLGWLDRHIKETLRVRGYVRYMDDLVIWGADHDSVAGVAVMATEWSRHNLGLELKPAPMKRTADGFDFLGCRVYSSHIGLSRRSRVRWQRRVRWLMRLHRLCEIGQRDLQSRLEAATAFTFAADARTWRFRQSVLDTLPVGDP